MKPRILSENRLVERNRSDHKLMPLGFRPNLRGPRSGQCPWGGGGQGGRRMCVHPAVTQGTFLALRPPNSRLWVLFGVTFLSLTLKIHFTLNSLDSKVGVEARPLHCDLLPTPAPLGGPVQ